MKDLREMLRGMNEYDVADAFGRFMAHAWRRGRGGGPPSVHFVRGGALHMAACEGYAQWQRERKLERRVRQLAGEPR